MSEIKNYLAYNKFINELAKNQNVTSIPCLQDIYITEKYRKLFHKVLILLRENPNANITTLRFLLFQDSGLRELISSFVNETKITPSILLDFGTQINRDTILCGNSQEVVYKDGKFVEEVKPIEINTIFDLASTSKLFTAVAILKLYEDGFIDIYDPVNVYAPEFTELGNITIYDLLKFRVMIVTDKRVDSAKTKEEAEAILRTVHPKDDQHFRNGYTDMGAMVLRHVVENVTNVSFNYYVNEEIFKVANMTDTYLNVPEEKLYRVANENYSSIVDSQGNIITSYNNYPGTPHDPKARAIGQLDGIAPGHAGYFSTKEDMIKFGQALIDGTIISSESVLSMSDTETGYKDEDGWTRFYGSLVYLKQLEPHSLSVYPPLSGKAFMSPGFAGTTLIVDPLNKLTVFVGANRLHNRIYQVHPDQKQNIVNNPETKEQFFVGNDGEIKTVCSDFTARKETLVRLALDLTLQLQLLEKLKPKENGLRLVRELN